MSTDTSEQNSIAVIGMSCKVPGANDYSSFWQNIVDEKETISFFDQATLLKAGVKPQVLQDPNYVSARGILTDIDQFDANFFGISPSDAQIMDPQYRVFLEQAWAALEDSGYAAGSVEGLVAVFAGMADSHYLVHNLLRNTDVLAKYDQKQLMLATSNHFLAAKIAYALGLTGPAINISTACSTGLVAIINACDSLTNYDCDMALAGGITIIVPQHSGYRYQAEDIYSIDGHCRPFDASAKGTVISNGCGIVVLKRLSDALKDHDTITAVIKGWATNNDGSRKVSFAAPSVAGQATCVRQALAYAQLDPTEVSYIEAHGTGTTLGDPIELAALTQGYQYSAHKQSQYCAIGSVKSNIGHTDVASGVIGFIKAALALKHKILPATLHYTEPNPEIDFSNSPFYVNHQTKAWESMGKKRIAGVTALGFGGTNAHLIMQEPSAVYSAPAQSANVLLLSAKTAESLERATQQLALYLKQHADDDQFACHLADVAYTLQLGRKHFNYRRVIFYEGYTDLLQTLKSIADDHVVEGSNVSVNEPRMITQHIGSHGSSHGVDPLSIAKQLQINLSNDPHSLIKRLANKWLHGHAVKWEVLYANEERQRVPLPTYAFDHQRYWVEPSEQCNTLNDNERSSDLCYSLTWERELALASLKPGSNVDGVLYHAQPIIPQSVESKCYLVFIMDHSLCHQLVASLKLAKHKVFTVSIGERFSKMDGDAFMISPQTKSDYSLVLRQLDLQNKELVVIHCWSLMVDVAASFSSQLQCGAYSLLYLSQAFSDLGMAGVLKVLVLSRYMYSVLGHEVVLPAQSAILGPCKVIPQEQENILFKPIDVDFDTVLLDDVVDSLCWELNDFKIEDAQNAIAYRGAYRWFRRLKSVEINSQRNPFQRLKKQGIYLITGGLGGIGLTLAAHLAKQYQANLVLVSRSDFPDESVWGDWIKRKSPDALEYVNKIKVLMEMQQGASSLHIKQAAVDSEQQLSEVIHWVDQQFGRLDGVLHIAGIPGEGVAQSKTVDTFNAILQPKLDGTAHLFQLLKHQPLDFIVLFSSMSAIYGVPGQVDYCAANAVMDAFVDKPSFEYPVHVATINWPSWREVGMAAAADNSLITLDDSNSLSPAEGVGLFEQALHTDFRQILISKHRPERVGKQSCLKHIGRYGGAASSDALDVSKKQLTQREISCQLLKLWGACLGVSSIKPDDDFYQLGGDSLSAINLLSEVSKVFDIKLPLSVLLEARTVSAMSLCILESMSQGDGLPLVVLQDKGEQSPLFMLHPIGGTVFCYLPIVQQLEIDRPIYGVQDPSVAQEQVLFASLEEMASAYRMAIEQVQSKGPYYLCGSSFGAMLAFEIAHQLVQRGQEINFLGLLDGWASFSALQRHRGYANVIIDGHQQDIDSTILPKQIENLTFWETLFQKRLMMMLEYSLKPLPVEIHLFKAKALLPEYEDIQAKDNHWSAYSTFPVNIHPVPGDHNSILQLPNAVDLAKSMQGCLDGALSATLE